MDAFIVVSFFLGKIMHIIENQGPIFLGHSPIGVSYKNLLNCFIFFIYTSKV